MNWHLIQDSFRGSFEGAVWGFVLLALLGFGIPILWHLWSDRHKKSIQLKRIRRRLAAKGIGEAEWRLMQMAIQSTCPENPERLLGSISLFHSWMDSLPNLNDSPELMASLGRIKELAYPDSHHVFVPHSTRDLVAGAGLNLVAHRGGQEVVPCIVSEVTMDGLRLARRSPSTFPAHPGELVSLFYPRPEAMYHAIVTLQAVAGAELRTSHSVQGNFKIRQLREFWRVDVDMELSFHVFPELVGGNDLGLDARPDIRPGRLINLSGNGAAIVTTTPPRRGAHIAFSLQLPSRTLYDLHAEVLHVSGTREITRMHLVFRNLDPGDQELIIRNLFLIYREQVGDPVEDGGHLVIQNRT